MHPSLKNNLFLMSHMMWLGLFNKFLRKGGVYMQEE